MPRVWLVSFGPGASYELKKRTIKKGVDGSKGISEVVWRFGCWKMMILAAVWSLTPPTFGVASFGWVNLKEKVVIY